MTPQVLMRSYSASLTQQRAWITVEAPDDGGVDWRGTTAAVVETEVAAAFVAEELVQVRVAQRKPKVHWLVLRHN